MVFFRQELPRYGNIMWIWKGKKSKCEHFAVKNDKMIFVVSCLCQTFPAWRRAVGEGGRDAQKVRDSAYVPVGGGSCHNAQDAVFVLWQLALVILFYAFEEKNTKKFAGSLIFI